METYGAEVAWGQIIGTRKSQQDHGVITTWPNGFQLLILADGMGGHVGGQEASELIVSSFKESFVASAEESLRTRLLNGLEVANVKVFEYVKSRPELRGMGATLLAAVFDGSSMRWISVGDSPLWLFREGKFTRLNENHSMAAVFAERISRGEMTEEEAANSPERSQLLEAVLGANIEQVDLPEEAMDVRQDDVYLLASDGVETCSVAELETLLASNESNADETVQAILAAVEKHDRRSQDNSTVMVMKIIQSQADVMTVA